VLPDNRFLLPLILWAAHTHCWEACEFEAVAYLNFTGVRGSGKNHITGNMFLPMEGIILNAEDFYFALLAAAQQYFAEVRQSADLQLTSQERIGSERAGAVSIREIVL
jgi:hypothetical protein